MRYGTEMVAGHHVYVVASGAGPGIQSHLWMIPGASGFLVGCNFPYAPCATDEFLGFQPESYCSREEAFQLAMESFIRARVHGLKTGVEGKPMGVAVSCVAASLTSPPRRGDHRIFAAVVTEKGAWIKKVILAKGMGVDFRSFDNAEAKLSVEDVMSMAVSGEANSDVEVVPEEELRTAFFKNPLFLANGTRSGAMDKVDTMYCGAFNPLHDGHREIMRAVERNSVQTVSAYTICADHPHKPGLTVTDMLSRAAAFRIEREKSSGPVSLLFTQKDPLFIQKFEAFPFSNFVMGVDTFIRMMDPKWGVDPKAILEAAKKNNINVAVSDRIQDGKTIHAWAAINALVPSEYRRNWKFLEGVHCVDMSSTKIREAAAKKLAVVA